MAVETYNVTLPRTVYSGKNALNNLKTVVAGAKKVAIFTDKGILSTGLVELPLAQLKEAGVESIVISDLPPEPTYTQVQTLVDEFKASGADFIVAVGGGSVMDCCKAVALAARYGGDIWDDFWARPGVIDFEPLPLGVVVTVAGTGSECNGGAVITNEEKKVKTGRDYPKLNPRFALMDPTYTFSVSKKQMASGSFDILSHIMETYFSEPNEDNVSDDIMEALMRSVVRNLRAAMDNPEDYTARSNLMWDSTMAENRLIKMGKKCDFECHNMEHQLGAYTNCNHGCGLAVIHPVYYRHIFKAGLPKFVRFAENVWGIARDGKSDEELALAGIDALADFIREIGLPATLKELGVHKTQLKEIADSCGISQGAYKPITHEEILAIFRECYE